MIHKIILFCCLNLNVFSFYENDFYYAPAVNQFLKNQKKLVNDLFDGYDATIAPIYSQFDLSKPVDYDLMGPKRFNYSIFLYFLKIVEVIEPEEKVSVILEIAETWYDARLTWDPTLYNDIRILYVRQERVWSPTISSFKINDMTDFRDQDFRMVGVDYRGHINSTVSLKMSLNCPLDVTKFPFDTQTCVIQFSLPLFAFKFTQLFNQIYHGILDKTVWKEMGNSEWELVNLTNRIDILSYGDGFGDFQLATFEIKIRRNPMYYLYMIVLPSFIINTLSIIGVFMRKSDRMSKVVYYLINYFTLLFQLNVGLTNIMTMTFILGVMADKIPKTGSIPLLGIHIVVNLFITVVAIGIIVLIGKFKKSVSKKSVMSQKMERTLEDWIDIICMVVLEAAIFANFFVIIGFWIWS
ncbi:Protein CBG01219 [Caenorhabditis briggsae]|uniref:Protein CBG01219 n=1 Tax=Caenorhabditis briggsae TaxID=6238 RepID=A8WPV5_CAEBR|nr:Protein CBG01219 [Caenorhabditis briggsae]CAP22513.2 Protein CBG01219 [Caenorhabditis briggsae]